MDFKKASVAVVPCLAVFSFHERVENVKYDLFPGLSDDASSEKTGSSDLDDFNFGDDEGSKANDDNGNSLFSKVADETDDDDTFGFPKADSGASHLAADTEELHPDLSAYGEGMAEANAEDDAAESTTSPDSSSDDGTSYLDSLFGDKSADASTSDASATGGESLSDGDSVQVQYKLRLADSGKEVYKQWGAGEGGTFDFQLGGGHVIPGFDSAVSQMSVGEEKTVTIPASEAYGSKGFKAMGIPPNADLEYTLKVVGAN